MTRLRSDLPTKLCDPHGDAFGHLDYVAALAQTVRTVDAPFTVGLFGEWGSGKTGILEEVQRQLDSPDTAVVVFDAWRYEGEALRREFLTDVSNQLQRRGHLKLLFSRRKLLEELTTERTIPKGRLGTAWRDLGVAVLQIALAAVLVFAVVSLVTDGLGFEASTVEKTYPVIIGATLAAALNLLTRTIRIEHVQVRTPRLQDPDLFTRRFERMLKSGLKPKRLVIAIDNLDRCAPDRVTQLLGTIKTFLEPRGLSTHLIFVIAADDEALRRHLTAKEASISPDDEEVEVVGESVDEYLRKFFNASIRVVDALDEDIQKYTRRQFEDFIADEQLSDEVAGDLVDMVVSALRRNPRRIKQFVNNLQLRLDLLRAREASGAISPRVSNDVRLVAKLLIIEEQWPERYEELHADHRRLRELHDAAAASPKEPRAKRSFEGDEAFEDFLLATQHISDRRARAVIHLKLEAAELSLPRYADFVEALDAGRSSTVMEVLAEDETSEQQRHDYAKLVATHFRVQLRRSRTEALNTVRVLTEVPELQELEPSAARRVITEAANRPAVALRTKGLDAKSLFELADRASDDAFSTLVEHLVAASSGVDDYDKEFRLDFASELAPYVGRLNERAKDAIRAGLSGTGGTNRGQPAEFDSYLDLVVADPTLLPETGVAAALEAVQAEPNLTTATPAYRIASLGVLHGQAPDGSGATLLGVARAAILNQLPGDTRDAGKLARSVLSWLGSVDISEEVAASECDELAGAGEQIGPDDQHVIVLIGRLMARAPAGRRQEFASKLAVSYIGAHLAEALPFIQDQRSELPDELLQSFADQLVPVAAGETGNPDEAERATRLLRLLPEAEDHLASAGEQAVASTRPESVRIVFEEGADGLGHDGLSRVIDAVVNAAASPRAANAMSLVPSLLALEANQLTDVQLGRVEEAVLLELGQARQQEAAVEFLKNARSRASWRGFVKRVSETLAERVVGQAASDLSNLKAELLVLAGAADDLPPPRRHELVMAVLLGLGNEATAATQARPVLEAMASAAREPQRLQYTEQLITIERNQGTNYGVRQELLRAAKAIAGGARSESYKVLKTRLDDLIKNGSSDDAAMAKAVRDS